MTTPGDLNALIARLHELKPTLVRVIIPVGTVRTAGGNMVYEAELYEVPLTVFMSPEPLPDPDAPREPPPPK